MIEQKNQQRLQEMQLRKVERKFIYLEFHLVGDLLEYGLQMQWMSGLEVSQCILDGRVKNGKIKVLCSYL